METVSSNEIKKRVQSIDILRGLIMLIMAIDHTRDFFHIGGPLSDPTNLATTTPILFFTRWITHFCAPGFVFLSGVSAYLYGFKRTKKQLSTFLFKRGVWLIFIEVAIITLALSLNPLYNFVVLQVIWAIGTSMVILSLLVWAPLPVIALVGAIIFFGHNVFDFIKLPEQGTAGFLWKMFFTARSFIYPINQTHYLAVFYAILPWTGVMLIGYVFGALFKPSFNPLDRRKILLLSGTACIVLFVLLRYFNIYGDPFPWSPQKNPVFSVISFLNTTKYPCSLLYLCMTLGPSLIGLALIENVKNKFTSMLVVYGSVPFFYYVLHFYLIRVFNVIAFFASGYKSSDIIDPKQPFLFHPASFGFNLGIVYLVWLLVIACLYLPCKWYGKYKRTHQSWWLSYL